MSRTYGKPQDIVNLPGETSPAEPEPDPRGLPSGTSVCGCAGCLEIFSSLSSFDKHQKINYGDDARPVICLPPAGAGLVLKERTIKVRGSDPPEYEEWGVWHLPGDMPAIDRES